MACVYPALLWDSAMRQPASLDYSGSITSGFEPANSVDWRDFSLFRTSGVSTLDATLTADTTLNMACIYPTPGVETEIVVQYETAPGSDTFNDFATFASAEVGSGVPLASFNGSGVVVPAGAKVRIFFNGPALDIRQVAVGPWLVPQIGQRDGLNPPTLNQGVVRTVSIAENGSILGSQVRRLDRKSAIDLEYLSEDWVRNSWEPFSIHMNRYACFYSWDWQGHPDEITFAAAAKIDGPKNQSASFMRVSMPLRNIV